jgi:hypothetical protein
MLYDTSSGSVFPAGAAIIGVEVASIGVGVAELRAGDVGGGGPGWSG